MKVKDCKIGMTVYVKKSNSKYFPDYPYRVDNIYRKKGRQTWWALLLGMYEVQVKDLTIKSCNEMTCGDCIYHPKVGGDNERGK